MERTVRLYDSKNKSWRVTPIGTRMITMLKNRYDGINCGSVFYRHGGRGPIKDFRRAWDRAISEAGLEPTLLFHDLRRSAVRNYVQKGIDKSIAKRLTGHKTDAVFERYLIVSQDDLKAIADRMDEE